MGVLGPYPGPSPCPYPSPYPYPCPCPGPGPGPCFSRDRPGDSIRGLVCLLVFQFPFQNQIISSKVL